MKRIQAQLLQEMGSQIDAKVSVYSMFNGEFYVSLPHHIRTESYDKAFSWLTHIRVTEFPKQNAEVRS